MKKWFWKLVIFGLPLYLICSALIPEQPDTLEMRGNTHAAVWRDTERRVSDVQVDVYTFETAVDMGSVADAIWDEPVRTHTTSCGTSLDFDASDVDIGSLEAIIDRAP